MGITERKEREKEHRREEILAAAQAVFFEKGLQSSTMDEIAEAGRLDLWRGGACPIAHQGRTDPFEAWLGPHR